MLGSTWSINKRHKLTKSVSWHRLESQLWDNFRLRCLHLLLEWLLRWHERLRLNCWRCLWLEGIRLRLHPLLLERLECSLLVLILILVISLSRARVLMAASCTDLMSTTASSSSALASLVVGLLLILLHAVVFLASTASSFLLLRLLLIGHI